MNELVFTVNQRRYAIPDQSPEIDFNLVEFLRKEGFTGCKQVCGEGGCGACTVVLSYWSHGQQRIQHHSVAACLLPLPFVHHMHITTIEGLSQLADDGLHPLSEAFYEMGASQCGFCTPGFIMAFVAHLAQNARPHKSELEHIFDGNLCRCTGYRPILDAASVFCQDPLESPEFAKKIQRWQERMDRCRRLDDIFPEQFKAKPQSQVFVGAEAVWVQPSQVEEILNQTTEDGCKLMAGNTDLGYLERYKPKHFKKYILLHRVAEMHQIHWQSQGLLIGAAVTIEQLADELGRRLAQENHKGMSGLKALLSQCRFLANHQIRSVATVGGGIMNFSHFSDLFPIWVACRAELRFRKPSGEERIHLIDHYNEDGTINFDPEKQGVLVAIFIRYHQENEFITNFKYSRRRLDSITFMSAGVRLGVDKTQRKIEDFVLSFDGLGSPGLRARKTERLLLAKVWDPPLLKQALMTLQQELENSISNQLPLGLQQYQIRLALGALLRVYKHYRKTFLGEADNRDQQLTSRYPEVAHRSTIHYEESPTGVLGKAIPHRYAKNQTTGQAEYTNDRSVTNSLYASIVTSPVASGRILRIDPTPALNHPEVVAFISAKDIPGKNLFGFRVADEEVLATERVHFVGQAVGVLVAKSEKVAREQAWAVNIEIEEFEPLLTIEKARETQSTHGRPEGYLLKQGDLDSGFAASAVVVQGEVKLPGQYHFYLEPQNALAIPKEGGFRVYSSTQSPSDVVDHVSRLMNVAKNRVEVQVGRLGGGFGGKQLRSGPIAAICALAAQKVGRPVRLTLDRAQDMAFCPGRSPILAQYKAGFAQNGRIMALDMVFYMSGGFSCDYSADITETATLLMDSGYRVDNIRVKGTCLRTNYGSATSTRGFGKPQASPVIETVMDHGASALKMDATKVREVNIYRKRDRTITKTEIKDNVLRSCWDRLMVKADYQNLRREVEAFNKQNKWLKRGLAATVSKGNMGFIESDDINRGLALVHILRDGTVSVNHSGIEMGQGINTRMAQIAAASLSVPLRDVVVTDTQSALIPNTPPTTMVASDLIGYAIVNACDKINQSLAKLAGAFKERVSQAYEQGITLSATGIHTAPRLSYDYEKQQGDISYFFVWGAALSLVEVDVISGSFRILKSKIVQDCGKSLNPHLDIGQAEGGFMFGVGYYTMEEMIYSEKGQLITDNVSGYKIPSSGDVPLDWDIELLNYRPTLSGIHNSKGIGESNIQLGLSAYFAVKEAVRAARRENGMDSVFHMGFPSSVDRVSSCLPDLVEYAANHHSVA